MDVVKVEIEGEEIHFLPGRAAYWPGRKWLVAADLHWGKAETFQRFGMGVPSAAGGSDLERLSFLCRETGCETVLVLGDLVHSRVGVTPEVREAAADFFAATKVSMVLVRGNHDRSLRTRIPGWNLYVEEDYLDEGPFRFSHDARAGRRFVWHGHMHPMASVRLGPDRLRLPCFWWEPGHLVLPAFSSFSRGLDVKPGARGRVFALAGEAVVEIPSRRGPAHSPEL